MTKDEVTRIALECGFQLKELPDGTMGLRPYVYAFAKRLIEDEREACAKAAEGFPANRDWIPGSVWGNIRNDVAASIRAMGTT